MVPLVDSHFIEGRIPNRWRHIDHQWLLVLVGQRLELQIQQQHAMQQADCTSCNACHALHLTEAKEHVIQLLLRSHVHQMNVILRIVHGQDGAQEVECHATELDQHFHNEHSALSDYQASSTHHCKDHVARECATKYHIVRLHLRNICIPTYVYGHTADVHQYMQKSKDEPHLIHDVRDRRPTTDLYNEC